MLNRRREAGFTLIEILVVIAVISLLAAIAIMQYHYFKVQVYDTAAKSDLIHAMRVLEAYYVDHDTYPATSAELLANGLNLSENVSFTKYDLKVDQGIETVHMHIRHSGSPNEWHANYPKEGSNIQIRKPK